MLTEMSIAKARLKTIRHKVTNKTILVDTSEGTISYIVRYRDQFGEVHEKRFDNVFENLREQLLGDIRVYYR